MKLIAFQGRIVISNPVECKPCEATVEDVRAWAKERGFELVRMPADDTNIQILGGPEGREIL